MDNINEISIYIPEKLQKNFQSLYKYPLVILQAESGFGKTTAINEFLKNSNLHNIYSYTCMGETAKKSWSGICDTFRYIDINLSNKLKSIGFPTKENLVDILNIISECDVKYEVWMIIDNFQNIQNFLPSNILYPLSCHQCTNLHIVINTQFIKSIDILGIQSNNIFLIENNIFVFTENDIDAYFRINGILLSKSEIIKLKKYTGGWAYALSLQLIHYINEGNFDSSNSISLLMRRLIYNRLDVKNQRCLLVLSLLDQFSIKQIYTITEENFVPDKISRLIYSKALIRYEPTDDTYIIHDLLKDFLNKEIKSLSPEEIMEINKLAGDAHAIIGDYFTAIMYYLETKEMDTLLSLPVKAANFSLYPRNTIENVLKKILLQCDDTLLAYYPETLTMIIFQFFRIGCYSEFESGLNFIEKIISQPNKFNLSGKNIRKLTGQLYLLKSFAEFNNIEKMSFYHRKAWEVMECPFSNRIDWDDSWTFGQPSIVYMFWSKVGKHNEIINHMDKSLLYYLKLTNGHGSGADYALKAEFKLLKGDFFSAEVLSYKAIYIAEAHQQDSICFSAEMTLLRIAITNGDIKEYKRLYENIKNRAKNSIEPHGKKTADIILSFSALITGIYDISDWLKDISIINQELYDVAKPFAILLHLNWLLRKKEYIKIIAIAQELLPVIEEYHFLLPQVYLHILISISYYKNNRKTDAENALSKALSIAIPDEIYLPFAELEKHISPIIMINNTEIKNLSVKLKQGIEIIKKSLRQEKLSPREQTVAILASEGLTNKEIANRLFISPETVKTTMKGLFKKLNIKSRVQLQSLRKNNFI
ncbi:response regulator transcription factor [Clostridium sp. DL1XJH146]